MDNDRENVPLPTSEVPMSRVTIKELRLRNYRAFADARLVLDDVTFLVGRNGAGKSTLMDAFSFVSEAVTDSLETAVERRGNLGDFRLRLPHAGASWFEVSVAVNFEIERHGNKSPALYGFTLGREPARPGYVIKREVLQSGEKASGDGTGFDRNQNDFRCSRRDVHPVLDVETLVFPLVAGSDDVWKAIAEALKRDLVPSTISSGDS